jgi:hypothetical protein
MCEIGDLVLTPCDIHPPLLPHHLLVDRGAVEILCKMINPAKLYRKKAPKKGRERKQGART